MLSMLKRYRDIFRTSGAAWSAALALDRAGVRALNLWPARRVMPEVLREQVDTILRSWGMPQEDVASAVEHLIYADLHGIDSHGCAMIEYYHRELRAGRLTMTPSIRVMREGPTTALLDGNRGLGHIAANRAMQIAIEKCRSMGLGAVSVTDSNHFGAAGSYALMAADSGFIGIAMTNTAQPAIVPTFGRRAMLGTNPIAFAAPAARNRPFLLDMATSTVSLGKLLTAWRNGNTLPEGWAVEERGRAITNARLAYKHRRLTPLGSTREMGSHKGYGLAAMVEILSSLLAFNPAVGDSWQERRGIGHFFLALDPHRFRENGEFEANVDALQDSLRSTDRVNPEQPVLVAGDPERAAYEEHCRAGIPIPRSVIEDLRLVCRNCGVPFLMDPSD
jgi:LDH2 family malate/lactate/ureidoglycolate dehydrogenase